MAKTTNEKIAKIIKNLDALKHLFSNILNNYSILCELYEHRSEIEDVEYKQIKFAFNNFILISSILKEHIKSFEKDLDAKFIESKTYKKTKDLLFKDESYLILLGLRNYLQHVFHFKMAFGNIWEDSDEEDLFICKAFMLKRKDLHAKKPENQALNDYLTNYMALPIMGFSATVIDCMNKFYNKFKKIVNTHYNREFEKYNSGEEDNYAFDMHNIYLDNLNHFNDE